MENTEILVHISAPSGASDDARYRAQVEAILGFRSVSRQHISVGADATDDNNVPPGDALSPAPAHPSSESWKRLKSDGGQKSEYNGSNGGPNSETQSATTDNANEPESQHEVGPSDSPQVPDSIGQAMSISNQAIVSPKATSPQKQHGRTENDSLGTPVSVIPDSQPGEVHQVPERNLEYLDAQPQPPPEPPNLEEHRNSHTTSPSKKRRRLNSPKSGIRPKPRSITRPSGEKRSTPKSDTSKVSTKANTTDKHQHQQPDIQLTTLPLQIQPPPPPISTSSFTTHITPTLAMLAIRLNPSRIYKPVYQTRSLDKLERGHWFLRINVPDPELESDRASDSVSRRSSTIYTPSPKQDPSKSNSKDPTANPTQNRATCSHALLTRLWTFLSRFITQEARAGWGVWCILEEDTTSPPPPPHSQTITPRTGTGVKTTTPTETETENQSPNPTLKSTNLPLNLKIYTWGEISTHIYLLLFLASERRVRGMGAQWRDASGEVVVQMP